MTWQEVMRRIPLNGRLGDTGGEFLIGFAKYMMFCTGSIEIDHFKDYRDRNADNLSAPLKSRKDHQRRHSNSHR